MGLDPMTQHTPWLLFNVYTDPAERFPLTGTADDGAVLTDMAEAVYKHRQGLAWSYGDDGLTTARNKSFALCCDRARGCHCS